MTVVKIVKVKMTSKTMMKMATGILILTIAKVANTQLAMMVVVTMVVIMAVAIATPSMTTWTTLPAPTTG